jgi:cephalosporin-C deacetylase-like acetyl esterase
MLFTKTLTLTGVLAAGSMIGIWTTELAPSPAAKVTVTPLRASGIYAKGEKAGWNVTVDSSAKLSYVLRRDNSVTIASGKMDLSASGNSTINAPADQPGMLFLEVTPEGGKPQAYGAAVEPEKIQRSEPRPADFDRFWARKVKELHAVPENAKFTPQPIGVDGVDYGLVTMDHVNGTKVHGQFAMPTPKPGEPPKKYPAMLVLQWASPPYRLWPDWITNRAKQGWIVLNIEPHDVLPTEPQSYYDGLPDWQKNYAQVNTDNLDKNYFVEMYLRGVRAADFLTKHPNWDGKTLVVTGGSMGGQQSWAVAALHPKVTHMIINVPAGCDLNGMIHDRAPSYPFFDPGNEKTQEVRRYIDGVNFAARIKATSLVGMGFIDTACNPTGIWAAFNQLRGPKEAAPMVDSPHNNLSTEEQQRPFKTRESAWLDALGKRQPVKPLPFVR